MKNIAFLVEDDLHKEIKIKATMEEKSIKDYIVDLILEDLKNESK